MMEPRKEKSLRSEGLSYRIIVGRVSRKSKYLKPDPCSGGSDQMSPKRLDPTPTPGVFVSVASKGVVGERAVTAHSTRLKVAVFSTS
jgi:hypothetical protein